MPQGLGVPLLCHSTPIPFSIALLLTNVGSLSLCLYVHTHTHTPPEFPNNCLEWTFYLVFSSVQSLSHVWLFATPWIAAHQASLSITNSQSSPRLTSIESVMPSSHLILCRPLLLLPPIPPSIRVFSNESTLCMRCIATLIHLPYFYSELTSWFGVLIHLFKEYLLNTHCVLGTVLCPMDKAENKTGRKSLIS